MSEGAVDGPIMNEEGEGTSPRVVDRAMDQGIFVSEEGTRVHTYNLKQNTTERMVSDKIHRRLKSHAYLMPLMNDERVSRRPDEVVEVGGDGRKSSQERRGLK